MAILSSKGEKSGIRDVHLAVLLFGFSGLFGKFLLCSPLMIVCGRTVFASLFLLPFFIRNGRGGILPRPVFMLQGGLLALHWCAFFISIQLSSVAVGLLTFSTFPLFVTFLEPFFFKEPLRWKNVFIALVVFMGLVMVVPGFDPARAATQGALWGVMSGFTFALLGLVNRKNVASVPPMTVAFYQNLFAALFLLPWVVGMKIPMPTARELLLLVFLGSICTAVAHYLFIRSLVDIKTRTAGVITALEPVYGIVLAMLFLGEIPGLRTVAGGIVILGAAFLVTGAPDN